MKQKGKNDGLLRMKQSGLRRQLQDNLTDWEEVLGKKKFRKRIKKIVRLLTKGVSAKDFSDTELMQARAKARVLAGGQ